MPSSVFSSMTHALILVAAVTMQTGCSVAADPAPQTPPVAQPKPEAPPKPKKSPKPLADVQSVQPQTQSQGAPAAPAPATAPAAVAPAAAAAPAGPPQPLVAGDVRIFPYNFAPAGYVACDGRIVGANTYPALEGVIGVRFGGNAGEWLRSPGLPPLRAKKAKGFADIAAAAKALAPSALQVQASALKMESACNRAGTITQILYELDIAVANDAREKPPGREDLTKDLLAIQELRKSAGGIAAKAGNAAAELAKLQQAAQGDDESVAKFDAIAADVTALVASLRQQLAQTGQFVAITRKASAVQARTTVVKRLTELKSIENRIADESEKIGGCDKDMVAIEKDLKAHPPALTVDIGRFIAAERNDGKPFIGEIRLLAIGYTPTGWLPCDGRLLPVKDHQAMYSLTGNQFGGDGTKTADFAIPRLAAPLEGTNRYLQYYIATEGTFPPRP